MNRKSIHPNRLLLRYVTIIVILSLTFLTASAVTPKRIALLPFKINSAQDLSFLENGIFDMLTSRLSQEGQVEVLGREQVAGAVQTEAASGNINEATARRIGTRLNADFVLFGSLTVLGENVSIDAKMVDISGGKPTMTFYDQSQDLGAVIGKINRIAADINDKMFGRSQAAATAKAPAAAGAAAPATKPPPPPKSSVHAHPEKILQQDGFITHDKTEDIATPGIERGSDRESQPPMWRSASFKHLINGIALGDVDGDGKIETVILAPNAVIIFRSESGAFRKVAEIDEGFNKNLIAADCGDINGNGYAEIFVTSLNSEKKLVNSFVLEYDGSNFIKIIDHSRWYFRVAEPPGRGRILLGQRPRSGQPSAGTIYELAWQGGEYVPLDPIKTPRNTNLLGLTIGDVLNNDRETIVAYRENDHIRIIGSAGKVMWDGSEPLGGSMLYYNLPLNDRGQVENKMYYPLRLAVWHGSDRQESLVITVKNHDLANRKIDLRYFTKTHLESFKWDGVGLAPHWKTREFSGYIQDFSVGDFDNDSRDEIVAALIVKEGRIAFTEARSTIIGFELSSPSK